MIVFWTGVRCPKSVLDARAKPWFEVKPPLFETVQPCQLPSSASLCPHISAAMFPCSAWVEHHRESCAVLK